MRVLIIGAGRTARELIRRPGRFWGTPKPGLIFVFAALVRWLLKSLAWWYPEKFIQLLKGSGPASSLASILFKKIQATQPAGEG